MIRGNWLAFIMFVAVTPIAIIGGFVLKLGDPLTMIGVGTGLTLIDLGYRWRSRPQEGWLMEKKYGGYLVFFPIWIVGLLIILLNILVGLGLISP